MLSLPMAEAKITKRAEDYSRWYTDVIAAAELADYAPVKGCMIIRPNGYAIWEKMQQALDGMFKETGPSERIFPAVHSGKLSEEGSRAR